MWILATCCTQLDSSATDRLFSDIRPTPRAWVFSFASVFSRSNSLFANLLNYSSMLTRELEETLSHAVDEAVKHKHEFVTLEHLLFALLEDSSARNILFHCGAQIDELARALEEYFENVLEKMPANVKMM